MTKFLNNADIKGYIAQTAVTSYLLKADSTGRLVAAIAGTDYQAPTTALLPSGGTAGQILAKIDGTNYNAQWIDNFAQQIKYDVKLGAALSKGTPVYVSSANGTNIIVSASSNATEATSSKTLGLLETGGALNDIVKVVSDGLLSGLNTSVATIGDPVWLGVNGALIFGLANKPSAPAHLVYIGAVTRVHAVNGEIFIKVQNGFELDELHNVALSSVADGQGLFYESATSLWKNKTIASVLGYTPANGANYLPLSGGTISGDLTISSTNPRLYFTDTDNNPDYFVSNTDGTFTIYDVTNSVGRFKIYTTGNAELTNNLTAASFIKSGGTSAQFLKADGSVDSSTYLTSITSSQVTTALGYTPYNATNPSGYITSSALSSYLPLSGGTLTGALSGTSATFSGAVTTASPLTIQATNPYIQWKDANAVRLGYIQHATNLVMAADSGNIVFNTTLASATVSAAGLTTLQFNDTSGNRTSGINVLAIQAENSNAPYNGFGGAIVFNNRAYTSGIVASTRIRSQINNNSIDSSGGSLIFEVTPTVGGTLTAALSINYNSQLRLNAYTTSTSFSGTAAGYLAFDSSGNIITVAGVSSTVTAGFSLTTAGASNNTPSTPSVNAGVYAGTYAFIDLATQDVNGSWIDFSKGNGTDFSGRIRYYANPDRFGFHTNGGSEAITFTSTGTIAINKTGTLISHSGMTDAFGYNASYGTYIGSPLGGATYYIYANGSFYDNGTVRTLLHSGNYSSYALPLTVSGTQTLRYDTTTGNEHITFQNQTSGGTIQLGFQQNDSDGLHHRAYFKAYKSSAGTAAGVFDIVIRSVGGGTTTEYLRLEAGQAPKWGSNVMLHAGNYNSYSPTLTGGNASGTWGINVTGSSRSLLFSGDSAKAFLDGLWAGGGSYPGYQFTGGNSRFGFSSTGGVVDVYADGNFYATDSSYLVWHAGNAPRANYSNLMYYAGFTLDANTMPSNSTGFTYAVNAPYTGPIAKFSEDGYPLQLNATYGAGGTSIAYRTRNGDAGTWNSWYAFITTANIGSQSVSYANSSGTVSHSASRTDASWYNVVWASGNPSNLYSCDSVQILSGGGYLRARYFYTDGGGSERGGSGISYVAGFNSGDYYVRSYTMQALASSMSGATMNINGSSTSCTGNAASASAVAWSNVSSKPAGWLDTTNLIIDNVPGSTVGYIPSGFYQNYAGDGNPTGTWFNYINVRHSNPGNNHGFQIGMSYYDNNLWFRSYQGGGSAQAWAKALSTQNYNSYSPTLTGGGASGTWGINITGNANNITQYTVNQSVGSGDSPTHQTIYLNDWVRTRYESGIYFESYSAGLRSAYQSSFGQVATYGTARSGYGGYVIINNYVTNIMQNTSGDFGFFSNDDWAWRLFYNRANNCWGIGTDNTYSGDGFRCIKYGSAQYGWTTWSDRRAKENISTITGALDKVLNMRGVYFNYIIDEDKKNRVGFIAQELENVLPEAVRYADDIDEYSVEYAQIVSVLAEAIKEQNTEIQSLKAQLQTLLN